ncbi:putative L-type lectin-domain containing receptor kinase V.1 [Nymphaea colorata]|nr:putative L-type lectin-domain containing receptor kinase V.1 [Nymphaea colorata]
MCLQRHAAVVFIGYRPEFPKVGDRFSEEGVTDKLMIAWNVDVKLIECELLDIKLVVLNEPKDVELGGHGFAFVVAPSTNFSDATRGRYLDLFNESNNRNPTNHIFSVEFDTAQQAILMDTDASHVAINVNRVISNASAPAAYYIEYGKMEWVVLDSKTTIQAWIEYDGQMKQLNVTIAPLLVSKHYILGWSAKMSEQHLDLSRLPSISDESPLWKSSKLFLNLTSKKIEGWEIDYPHRFSYRELYRATKGFKDELGKGSFDSVYKGVMPGTGLEVAVKKVSPESKQGMREFVAEVSSLGRMRHINLVQLHGSLSWEQRFNILKGIASSLLLSDFGHARLFGHGTNPKTTHIVWSFGYMALELSHTYKSMTSSDVYSYGALLLKGGQTLDAMDKKLENCYVVEEGELVLKLGMLCSQTAPESRPNMQ